MASIDVRDDEEQKINTIIFADDAQIVIESFDREIIISDNSRGEEIGIHFKNIEMLIKALQKVEELVK